MTTDCTAREFVAHGFSQRILAVWQLRILCRAWLELNTFYFWLADADDYLSAREAAKSAKYTATFAFLAFPDLRPAEAKHIPQAEIVIEPPTRLGRLA